MKCACPCEQEFEPKCKGQIYFNAACRQRDKNRRWPVKRQSLPPALPRNGLGARQEAQQGGVTPLLGIRMADAKRGTILGQFLTGRHSGEECLTRQEVANLLGVTRWTGWYWGNRGLGPSFVKLVGRVRYPRRDFDEWVASLPRN